MVYFNGFSLQGEEAFFQDYLTHNEYTVAGFSYGAQQALEYALVSSKRIDRLILLSPAFFQMHTAAFIRTQLRYFKADAHAYAKQFLLNTAYPSTQSLDAYFLLGKEQELQDLLNYVWDVEKIKILQDRGIKIEVFLGEQDKIVESTKSMEFFSSLCSTYLIKSVGHLLCKESK
jgi:pimeloyl-ACP methyl ester carboxylesterase